MPDMIDRNLLPNHCSAGGAMGPKLHWIIAGVFLASCGLYALGAAEAGGTRRYFPELGFSLLVPSNTYAVKEERPMGPLPDMTQKPGSVSVSSNCVQFATIQTNSAYVTNGSSGACVMQFEVMLLTKAEFETRLADSRRYRGAYRLEWATYRTNSTVIRDGAVRRDFTRPDGLILSASAGFRLLDWRSAKPLAEDVDFMKNILDSISVDLERKPNPQGGANRSQPIRSETNSTSSAAGSRR